MRQDKTSEGKCYEENKIENGAVVDKDGWRGQRVRAGQGKGGPGKILLRQQEQVLRRE